MADIGTAVAENEANQETQEEQVFAEEESPKGEDGAGPEAKAGEAEVDWEAKFKEQEGETAKAVQRLKSIEGNVKKGQALEEMVIALDAKVDTLLDAQAVEDNEERGAKITAARKVIAQSQTENRATVINQTMDTITALAKENGIDPEADPSFKGVRKSFRLAKNETFNYQEDLQDALDEAEEIVAKKKQGANSNNATEETPSKPKKTNVSTETGSGSGGGGKSIAQLEADSAAGKQVTVEENERLRESWGL